MKTKFKLPKNFTKPQLTSLGFWYKNDQPEGLGLAAMKGDDDFELLKMCGEFCEKNFQQEQDAVLNKKPGYEDFNGDLDAWKKQIQTNLEICIPWLKDPNSTTEEKVIHLVGFITGVIYLEKWGILKSDDNNGAMYQFMTNHK